MAKLTEDSTNPRQLGLSYVRKVGYMSLEVRNLCSYKVFASAPASRFLFQLLYWLPSMIGCNLQGEINPFFIRLLLIMVWITAPEKPEKRLTIEL